MQPELRGQQNAFTQCLRHPSITEMPVGVSPDRMAIYRELIRNNLLGFVESTFPVSASLLPQALWDSLCNDFVASARCKSPRFIDIPAHFLEHVAQLDWPQLAEYPWLEELMHFEWMELAVDVAETDEELTPDSIHSSASGWHVTAHVWPMAYQWPVANWSASTTREDIEKGLQGVLFWRDQELRTRMLTTTPLTLALVDQLKAKPWQTTSQLVAWATAAGVADAKSSVITALESMHENGVVQLSGDDA